MPRRKKAETDSESVAERQSLFERQRERIKDWKHIDESRRWGIEGRITSYVSQGGTANELKRIMDDFSSLQDYEVIVQTQKDRDQMSFEDRKKALSDDMLTVAEKAVGSISPEKMAKASFSAAMIGGGIATDKAMDLRSKPSALYGEISQVEKDFTDAWKILAGIKHKSPEVAKAVEAHRHRIRAMNGEIIEVNYQSPDLKEHEKMIPPPGEESDPMDGGPPPDESDDPDGSDSF